MLHAGCKANPDLLAPIPALENVKYRFLDTADKAYVDLESGEVTIDPDFLSTLSEDSAVAMLYHEIAHTQKNSCARYCDGKPKGCERCADNRLGACMAMAGYDADRTKRALTGLNLTRPTLIADTMAGFEFANTSIGKTIVGNRPPPPSQRQLPTPVESKEGAFQPIFAPKDIAVDSGGRIRPTKPVDVNPNIPTIPTIPNVPGAPTNTRDCSYDFQWIVGLSGGLFSLAIIATQWTFKP